MARIRTALFIFMVSAVLAGVLYVNPARSVAEELKSFSDKKELAAYIRENSLLAREGYGGEVTGMLISPLAGAERQAMKKEASAVPVPAAAEAYSSTNVQVSGVDEADIIKNDGKYIYAASGRQVHILQAWPAEGGRRLSSIECEGYPTGLFLNGSRLVVISRGGKLPGTRVSVYDVGNREKPEEVRSLAWEGSCAGSRMIGSCIYLVMNIPVRLDGEDVNLPAFEENQVERLIPPNEIFHFDYPDQSYRYMVIVAVDTDGDSKASACRTFLTGASQTVYASTENLYLAGTGAPDMRALAARFIEGIASLVDGDAAERIREIGASSSGPADKISRVEQVLEGLLAGMDYAGAADLEEKIGQLRAKFNRDMQRERDKTVIYSFSLRGGSVEYRARGEVAGRLLNQFSMDEDGGYFRVATTSQGFLLSDRPVTRNNIYVLNQDLTVAGRLEGMAPGERIYSARFMGGRAYMVTFRNIDPLFVVDLRDPTSPRVLGELKIPGFSDYLHPYDESHLIGVGKEVAAVPAPRPLTDGSVPGGMPQIMPPVPVRQQGVKVALFDVSDPSRPVEISKYVVEQPGSDSEVSRDHRAFLFSRSRNLMALPVSYAEIAPAGGKIGGAPGMYNQWQGMYVFNISVDKGISLRGTVVHPAPDDPGYAGSWVIRRAAYIEDVLYTVSDLGVEMSRLEDLREIKFVSFPLEEAQKYRPWPLIR